MDVLIRGVPWNAERSANAARLCESLPNAQVVWDQPPGDSYRNFQRALRLGNERGALHLEDDVQLTSDFPAKVAAAVTRIGTDRVIQFFSRRKADVEIGTREAGGRDFSFTVCFYVPPGLGSPAADYLDVWPDRQAKPTYFDYALGGFLVERGIRFVIHVPSLVQHRQWVSAIDRRRGKTNRQSATFVE
jgi:hypothetical protein